jgi:hypothetical protein
MKVKMPKTKKSIDTLEFIDLDQKQFYRSPDIARYVEAQEPSNTLHSRPILTFHEADDSTTPDYNIHTLTQMYGPFGSTYTYPAFASVRIPVAGDAKTVWQVTLDDGARHSPTHYTELEQLLVDNPTAKLNRCLYSGFTPHHSTTDFAVEAKLIRDLHKKYVDPSDPSTLLGGWLFRFCTFACMVRPGVYTARLMDKKSWYTKAEIEAYHATGMPTQNKDGDVPLKGKSELITFLSRRNDDEHFYKHKRALNVFYTPYITLGLKKTYRKYKGKEKTPLPFSILPIVSTLTLNSCPKLRELVEKASPTEQLYLHHAFKSALILPKTTDAYVMDPEHGVIRLIVYPSAPSSLSPRPLSGVTALSFEDIFTRTHDDVWRKVGHSGNHEEYVEYIKSLYFSRPASFEDVNCPNPDAFKVSYKAYDMERNRAMSAARGVPVTNNETVTIDLYRGRPLYMLRYFNDEAQYRTPREAWDEHVRGNEWGARMVIDQERLDLCTLAFKKSVQEEYNTKMLKHGTRSDMIINSRKS